MPHLVGINHGSRGQRNILLGHIAELAHITGPVRRDEQLHGLGRIDLSGCFSLGSELFEEVVDQ